jgi:hypothetical protein
VRFNPKAILVLVAFCLLLLLALSSGSAWIHGGEAIVTVLILLNLFGFAGASRPRTR